MDCIVTGGAGFIGANLCRALLHAGHSVVCIDNFQTGSLRNIEELLPCARFTLIERDVREPLPPIGRADRIFNLACPASPPHYQADPAGTILTNVIGTRACLELAQATGAVMVQASTSEVYGDPAVSPQPEAYWGNVNPYGPRACYDEGKRCAEALCYAYRTTHGVRCRIARIFNAYGPFMDCADGRAMSNFIVQALSGEALTVYGDGEQTRSFCFVDDTVRGLMALANAGDEASEPVNLGNPVEVRVLDLAHRIIEAIDPALGIEYRPLPTDDPRRRRPDISRARKLLGWEPAVSLDEGLAVTIDYFRRRI